MTSEEPARSPEQRGWPRRRVVILATILSLIAVWWLTSARSLWGGAGIGGDLAVGETLHIGQAGIVRDDVSLLRLTPNASEGLEVEFVVCHRRPGATAIGSVHDLDQYCSQVDPVGTGTSLPVLSPEHGPGRYLVATLTPTQPGIQWLCGFDAIYRAGWRFGWQRDIGSTVLLNAEDDASSPCD